MERKSTLQTLKRHAVICNCSEKVRNIVEELHKNGTDEILDAVLIVQDIELWESNPQWHPIQAKEGHFFTIAGCPTDKNVLRQANIHEARAAIILSDPRQGEYADAHSTLIALAIEHHNPDVHTVIELISSTNRIHLKATKIDEVICLGEISEKLIAQSCITPGIKNLFERLLSTEQSTNQIFLPELPARLTGQTYRNLARAVIQSESPFILCGFIQNRPGEKDSSRSERIAVLNPRANRDPGKDTPLHAGDQLIVIAHSLAPIHHFMAEANPKD